MKELPISQEKPTKKTWSKRVEIGDESLETQVREIENGYIVKTCHSYKNDDGYQYDEKEKFSTTNPISEDPDATTSKPIKDLYKELFNDDWNI